MGEMQGRCRGNTGEMQGRCRGDAGEIQCEHVRLPAQMNALVEAVSAATSRLVVVLLAGSPCALP